MTTLLMGAICAGAGCIIGLYAPTIPYEYSKYLAIAIMAIFDSIIGALVAKVQEKFNINVFISGFFLNAIIAITFTIIGESLDADIYLAAIFVFVYRIFNNLSVLRRIFIEEVTRPKNNKNK